MPLLGTPIVQIQPVTAQGGDPSTLKTSIERALLAAAAAGRVLCDVRLSGGGAGALWLCELVTSPTIFQATLTVSPATVAVRVVQAPGRAELEAEIRRAVLDLAFGGSQWIPAIVIAGGGAGAVWMGVVLGSSSPIPAPGGGGSAFEFPNRLDCSVNSGRVSELYTAAPVLHTQPAANPAGGFNGGGTGNKAILGLEVGDGLPLGALQSLSWTWLDLSFTNAGPFETYSNLVVDVNGDGSLYKVFVNDPASVPALLNTTNVTNGDGSVTSSVVVPANLFLIVNDLAGVVPVVNLGPSWLNHGYALADVLAVYPNAKLKAVNSGDGGLPAATRTPAWMLLTGDSGNHRLIAMRITGAAFNGAPA